VVGLCDDGLGCFYDFGGCCDGFLEVKLSLMAPIALSMSFARMSA